MKLVIAEKPSVAKAICPVLGAKTKKNGYVEGNGYIVSWCFGHLVGMYMPNDYGEKWSAKWSFEQLPMFPETWKFKINSGCAEQFKVLKTLMNDNNVTEIICATDADREGECIFRYVYRLAGCRKPVKRLWVSSLEETAIRDGMKKLKNSTEYDNLYSAGFSRAKADWLVGMNASRLFSIRYRTPLNLGRVQTPTLAMIVKRDSDVKNFVKQKFFTVDLNCGSFIAVSERIDNESNAEKIAGLCNGKNAVVVELKKEIKNVNPPKLFDLTTLQREANKQFGYTAQQTLDYLQSLYESKLTTYPRTDSQYLSDDMEQTAIKAVSDVYSAFSEFNSGISYTPDVKRCINNKKVSGHHAILPTEKITTSDLSALSDGQKDILMLVSAQLLLATGTPHKYESVKVTVNCENTLFTANGKTVKANGWKSIEERVKAVLKNKNSTDENENATSLPDIQQGQMFNNVSAKKSEHFTAPPKPYTEDTLLSAMEHAGQENYDENSEKKGLGTPATRAGTIEGLVTHGFAQRKGKQISATEKGLNLIKCCPEEVKSPKLTADWEMKLQQIEHGEYSDEKFMHEIISFIQELCKKYSTSDNNDTFVSTLAKIGNCPNCGKEVVKGKFGYYCTAKCGMNIAKVYDKKLTEIQMKKLLSGKEISYTVNDKKTIVLPKSIKNEYQGKTYIQWETKKG
ncbi:MAG: DNA topoisomerase 3, partial [Ruminococcus sp.]|nr:DNA topoisomerase 3 [Ruminococcus sp.]